MHWYLYKMNDIKFDSKKLSKDEILRYLEYRNINEPYKYIYEYNIFINFLNNKYLNRLSHAIENISHA